MKRSKAEAIRRNILVISESLPDSKAWETPELFPVWEADIDVTAGERYPYGGKLYKVVQAHHTQAQWTPDATPALWTEVAKPGEIPEWRQPTGSHDAYMTGDQVRHNGKVWESTMDYNVYEPGIYGWTEL